MTMVLTLGISKLRGHGFSQNQGNTGEICWYKVYSQVSNRLGLYNKLGFTQYFDVTHKREKVINMQFGSFFLLQFWDKKNHEVYLRLIGMPGKVKLTLSYAILGEIERCQKKSCISRRFLTSGVRSRFDL